MIRSSLVIAATWLAVVPGWAQQQGPSPVDRLMQMDTDGDGAITRDEAEQARAVIFARLDSDSDGFLSAEERAAAPGGGRGIEVADGDRDGRVSRDEAMSQPYRMFERLDSNSDGVIGADELERVRAQWNGG